MKKCKACQEEISDKATKCPKCGADQRNWFIRHKVLSVVLALVLIAVIASAANGSNSGVNTTPTSANSSSNSGTSNQSKAAVTAHVGSTVNVGGSKGLAVTLTQVIDPATGADQYTTADAGKRFVGLVMKITNNGSASYSDDANSNLTLIGSDNQSYTADFSSLSECTNFSNGQYNLAPGESATGCVAYQLPNNVKPAKAQFTSNGGFSGSTAEWLIP